MPSPALTVESLIRRVLEELDADERDERIAYLVCHALESAYERGESWLPWLIMWPDANLYQWAPSARAAMRRCLMSNMTERYRIGLCRMYNVHGVLDRILDEEDFTGTLSG